MILHDITDVKLSKLISNDSETCGEIDHVRLRNHAHDQIEILVFTSLNEMWYCPSSSNIHSSFGYDVTHSPWHVVFVFRLHRTDQSCSVSYLFVDIRRMITYLRLKLNVNNTSRVIEQDGIPKNFDISFVIRFSSAICWVRWRVITNIVLFI